jgi:hypothetical protein
MKGRTAAAKSALGRLTQMPKDSPEVEVQYAEIEAALEADRRLGGGSYIGEKLCFTIFPVYLTPSFRRLLQK